MKLLRRLVALFVVLNVTFVAVLALLKRNVPSLGDETSDELALAAIMDGRTLKSKASAFRGGSSMAVAGAQVLDLRRATLAPGGATLALRTFMGAIALVVPRSWPVEVNGRGMMGACEDTRPEAEVTPVQPGVDKLVVDALGFMGSVTVGYKPDMELEGFESSTEIDVAPTVV